MICRLLAWLVRIDWRAPWTTGGWTGARSCALPELAEVPSMSAADVIDDFFTEQPTRIRVERSDSAPLCYIAFGSRYRKLPFNVDEAARLRDALTKFINETQEPA
jgi:hypothetical protein